MLLPRIFCRILLSISCSIFLFLCLLPQLQKAQAATLYWVGADGANASVASNWKTTNPASCGGGNSVAAPTSADTLNFDPDCDNSASLDSSFTATVSAVVLNAGYVGTVTQTQALAVSTTFTISGGTWTAGSQLLSIGGNFNMSGSTFTASSVNTTFSSSFTYTSGTFNMNGGVITFAGSSASITCNGLSFNSVVLSGTGKTVASTCNLPLGNNPGIGPTGTTTLNGTLTGTGTLTSGGILLLNTGSALSGFSGLNVASITVAGATANFSSYSSFVSSATVSLSSGSLTLPSGADLNGTLSISGGTFTAPSGTMTLASSLTISNSPTFNANGGTIIFDGSGTMSCNNVTFNSVQINNTGLLTVNSTCNFPLGSSPSIPKSLTLNGTLTGTGTLILRSIPSNSTTLTLNSGASLSGFSGISYPDQSGTLTIAGATVDFGSYATANINRFTLSSGTFTAPSGTMGITGNFTISPGATFNANSGTVNFSGDFGTTASCNNAVFNRVTITHNNSSISVSSDCTFPLGNNPTIQGWVNLLGTLSGTGTLTALTQPISSYYTILLSGTGRLSGFTGIDAYNVFPQSGGYLDLSSYTYAHFHSIGSLGGSTFIAPPEMIVNTISYVSGVFNANGGTIIFDDGDNVIESPQGGTDLTLYNLKKIGTGSIKFPSYSEFGKKVVVTGTLALQGTSSPIQLRASITGNQSSLDAQGPRSLSNLDVKDMNASNAENVVGFSLIDSGNNSGWNFSSTPITLDLKSPDDKTFTNSLRPAFTWKAASDFTKSGISSYALTVNKDDADSWEVTGIPASPPSNSDRVETGKYILTYENFHDNDLTNDTISVTSKSSSEWTSKQNDGQLGLGKRTWQVTANAAVGTSASQSRQLFVDTTGPTVRLDTVGDMKPSVQEVRLKSATLIVSGLVKDVLSGSSSTNQIVSGPSQVSVTVEKRNWLGLYQFFADQQFNISENFWSSNNEKVMDAAATISDKQSPFSFTLEKPLGFGKYRVSIAPKDAAGNTGTAEQVIVSYGENEEQSAVSTLLQSPVAKSLQIEEKISQAQAVVQQAVQDAVQKIPEVKAVPSKVSNSVVRQFQAEKTKVIQFFSSVKSSLQKSFTNIGAAVFQWKKSLPKFFRFW